MSHMNITNYSVISVPEKASTGTATETNQLVDYEGFQSVVNGKRKCEFFRQTLSVQKINELYHQKEQELMEMLSGML